jgi:hypothetical protein
MGIVCVAAKLILLLTKLASALHNGLTSTVEFGAKAVYLFSFAPSTMVPILLAASEVVLGMREFGMFC